jgi:protein dithiol oxidoreductase (disulfide-forming)
MKINRRDFSVQLLVAATVGAGGLAQAQTPGVVKAAESLPGPVEGKEFSLLSPPVALQSSGAKTIEVLEFFSYACPHCSAFEPALEAWSKSLSADVQLRRVPVSFLANAENFQRTYFALEALGWVPTLQRKIFTAVHVDKLRLEKPAEIAEVIAKNGADDKKFLEAFNSFSVATQVGRAKKLTADYRLEGVPALAIQGKFVTSPSKAGSTERALAVADALIQRARKELG